MSPPAEPRSESIQVTFIDFPAAIGVSETFTPLTTSYPTFLSLLSALSGSIAHKLGNLSHPYVPGQGFTLSDGGWWYRFVKPPVNNAVSDAGVAESTLEKGPWTLLDCLLGYEKLVGEVCLGVKWGGAWVEVQHNLQKKRDESGIIQAHGTAANSQIYQKAALQYHHGCDSASSEPYYTVRTGAKNTETSEMSTVKDALQPAYDCQITTQDLRESRDTEHQGDDNGVSGLRLNENNTDGNLNSKYTAPLIVSSPVPGVVPPDDDGETIPSTPVAKPVPPVSEPSHTQSNTEVMGGPKGINYLPAHHTKAPESFPEMGFNSEFVSRPPLDSLPKFYPPPPGATGSPNDKYRQVPRSGGAIRNPNYRPYQHPYGGSEKYLVSGAFPAMYDQQQQFTFAQTDMGQLQYYSPASTFNQSGHLLSQSQSPESQQRLLFDQQSCRRGSYRGRGRGKYDVRKARGGHDKNNDSNRYSHGNQHQYGSHPNNSDNPRRFPLDPALEANYRNTIRQNHYNSGFAQNSNLSNTQNRHQPQNSYAGYEERYGNSGDNGHGFQYNYPTPTTFSIKSEYYVPSTSVAQQDMIPSFSYEARITARTQVAAAPTQEQPQRSFVPSPFAPTFVPRSKDVHLKHAEQVDVDARGQGPLQVPHFALAEDARAPQYQPHGMLPLAHAPLVAATAGPTGAEWMRQPPQLFLYAPLKPVVSMPPMGEFSPPKARKNGKQARKILRRVLVGTTGESVDAGNAATAFVGKDNDDGANEMDVGADEFDEGDSEYMPQNEDRRKKNRKPKKPKTKRRAGLGSCANNEPQAEEGEGASDVPSVTKATTGIAARPTNPTMTAQTVTPRTMAAARAKIVATAAATAVAESEAQVAAEEDEKMIEG